MNLLCFAKVVLLLVPAGGLSPVDHTSIFCDSVDLIECHTMHGPDGFPMFTQMIYWDWSDSLDMYVVRAWNMNKTVWVKSEEHKQEWLKILRDYCDKHPNVNFLHSQSRYRGEFDPQPGFNYPARKLNKLTGKQYWEMVFYHDGKRIVVTAPLFRETNTQNDPERDNREFFSEDQRLGINGYNKKHFDIMVLPKEVVDSIR